MPSIEPFTTTVMIKRDGQVGFVEVQVAPEQEDVEAYGIQNKEQYEAFVHHTLARNEDFLAKIHPGLLPEKILFNEQPHPEPHVTHDFAPYARATAARRRRCICMVPCNGPGSYCCIWWWEETGPRLILA